MILTWRAGKPLVAGQAAAIAGQPASLGARRP
jgi:hypothetical protein